MTTFSTTETKPVNTVFRLPVDTSTGPKGLLRSEYIQEQNSMLYPLVSSMPQEEVDQFLAAGMVGPVQAQAEGVTQQKKLDVYNEIIDVTRRGILLWRTKRLWNCLPVKLRNSLV